MPAKVLPNTEAFTWLSHNLVRRGFRIISRREFKNDFRRLGLIAPSPREGREIGFIFSANGLDVVVWTTFLDEEERARDKDAGWVLIRDGDRARYFARPLNRTKNFVAKLLKAACIARQRALHRPLCPTCKQRMRIAYGDAWKSRYWECKRPLLHRSPVFLPWDHDLPKEVLDSVLETRKKREPYRNKLRKEGKRPGAAQRKRKRWKVTRPENIVPSL